MADAATFSMLFAYNAWADDVLFAAMRSLPEKALYKETGTLFKSMVGTLNHNYQVDLIWRANMLGQRHGFAGRRDVLHARFEQITAAQREINDWFRSWSANATRETLQEVVAFNFASGAPGRMSRSAMLLHIVNHKTYHRGWISEMFFEAGHTPPEYDLSIFLCGPEGRHHAAH